jgi:hypothetical protein
MIMGEGKRKREFKQGLEEAITKWREVNSVMDLKIIFIGNLTLIGEYEDKVLKKPRALSIGQDPQGRGIVGIQLLIGEPESIEIINPFAVYDVKDEKVTNLYIQATTGIVPAKDLSNVRPIKPGQN